MLESAGRPAVAAGDDPDGAVGLCQISPRRRRACSGCRSPGGLEAADPQIEREDAGATRCGARRPGTVAAAGTTRPTVRRSSTVRISRSSAAAAPSTSAKTRSAPSRRRALLALAERALGREDWRGLLPHGHRQLEQVIEAYVAPKRPRRKVRPRSRTTTSVRGDPSTTPRRSRTRAHYALLADFGDDSRSYCCASRPPARSCACTATTPPSSPGSSACTRVAQRRASAAPTRETDSFRDPGVMAEASTTASSSRYRTSGAAGLHARPLAWHAGRGWEGAPDPGLYRGLRPEAVAALLTSPRRWARGGPVRPAGTDAALDEAYGRRLAAAGRARRGAAAPFLHPLDGFSFDIARGLLESACRQGLRFALERLRALRVIDYVYEDEEFTSRRRGRRAVARAPEELVPAR